MKHLLICGFSLLSLSAMAQSQEEKIYRNEVAVGYGFFNTSQMINIFSDALATAITGGDYAKTNSTWTGNFNVSYKFATAKRFSLGLTYAHTKNTADISVHDVPSGISSTNYHTLAGEFQYNYISKPYFRIYSILGAGVTSYTEKYKPNAGSTETNSAAHFNFQITPIGVKVGNRIGFFGELGFGYKGLISAGLYARL